jgi:hypothetical protein
VAPEKINKKQKFKELYFCPLGNRQKERGVKRARYHQKHRRSLPLTPTLAAFTACS